MPQMMPLKWLVLMLVSTMLFMLMSLSRNKTFQKSKYYSSKIEMESYKKLN